VQLVGIARYDAVADLYALDYFDKRAIATANFYRALNRLAAFKHEYFVYARKRHKGFVGDHKRNAFRV
jgi:hypothetical protein